MNKMIKRAKPVTTSRAKKNGEERIQVQTKLRRESYRLVVKTMHAHTCTESAAVDILLYDLATQ
jgi:hypothetical protein